MWTQLRRCTQLTHTNHVRHFLSDAYKCSLSWENRLQSPILQQIDAEKFFHELERKFNRAGKICAIDMDIFANKLSDNTMLSQLSEIMHKFRLTAEAGNVLDSTSHAIIRNYLDHGNNDLESLFIMLDDRLSYGVFLDPFTTNLLLDKLLRLKDYRMAAKVSTYLMLQEDFTNPINRVLSLYACYKYLANAEPFEDMFKAVPVDGEGGGESAAAQVNAAKPAKGKKREKIEEVRIRINYIRNPYFDDHFDLRNSHHLVGKTFLAIARHLNGTVANSVRLIGYTYYEKFAEGSEFVKSLGGVKSLHKDAIDIAMAKLAQITDRDNDERFGEYRTAVEQLAESVGSADQTSLENAIHTMTVDTVKEFESAEIDEQNKVSWLQQCQQMCSWTMLNT